MKMLIVEKQMCLQFLSKVKPTVYLTTLFFDLPGVGCSVELVAPTI